MNPKSAVLLAALLTTLMAGRPVVGGANASRFDAGNDGWQAVEFLDNDTNYASIFNGPVDIAWDPNNGQPAPCGQFTEPGSFGQTFYFSAPLKFLGDQHSMSTLEWSIKTSPGGLWEQPDVVLWGQVAGTRLVLVNSAPAQADTGWQHLTVSLQDPADWHVGTSTGPAATATQLEDVLEALEGLFIRGEFQSGVDASWIDNVMLVGEVPESTFDTDNEGWQAVEFLDNDTNYVSIVNGPVDIARDLGDGDPAPSGQFTEPDWFGQTFYFSAPLKFLGNQHSMGTLQWSIKTSPGGTWEQPDVVLWGQAAGARMVLVSSLPPQASTTWQTLSVSLRNRVGWRVGTSTGRMATSAELDAVVGALEGVFIRGEFRSGVDSSWIDNVRYTLTGDCNCDGVVNFGDIDYFVESIPDNAAAWQALYEFRHAGAPPSCPFANCDCTGDGHVDFADIDPFVALLGAPPSGIDYSFDTDVAGWGVIGVPDSGPYDPPIYSQPAQWDRTAGNPGGCVWWYDTWVGSTYFDAPTNLVSNLADAYGATLSWDIRVQPGGPFSTADVVLVSPSLVLVNLTPPQATPSWQTFSVPFVTTAGWTKYPGSQAPTAAEFQSVLSSLTALRIRAEYAAYDTAFLDNVVVMPPP